MRMILLSMRILFQLKFTMFYWKFSDLTTAYYAVIVVVDGVIRSEIERCQSRTEVIEGDSPQKAMPPVQFVL